MKKIMIVLLVLALAAPAAISDPNAITIDYGNPWAGNNGYVTLNYSGAAADANRPRAWGLTLSCDNGATMVGFTAATIGESTSGSPGYGIFPGKIAINSSGTVTDWGSPAYDGEGTNVAVVELGSLYSGSGNAPGTSGDLLTFIVTKDCNITVTENAADGCVLDEKSRRKHPTMNNPKQALVCPLDIAGGGGGGDKPDGWVGAEDLIYMLSMLNRGACVANGYYCDATTLPAAEALMDVAGGGELGDQPDGWVGAEDLIALLTMLNQAGCVSNGYYCQCP